MLLLMRVAQPRREDSPPGNPEGWMPMLMMMLALRRGRPRCAGVACGRMEDPNGGVGS